MAKHLHSRQERYVTFTRSLCKAIAHIYIAIQHARKPHDVLVDVAAHSSKEVSIKCGLLYPAPEAGTVLAVKPFSVQVFSQMSVCHKAIFGFLCSQRWKLMPATSPGITWIELLLVFLFQGGTHQLAGLPEAHASQAKPSLRVLLKSFVKQVRYVVAVFLATESLDFFKPSRATTLRLKELGFTNSVAALAGNISNLTEPQGSAIARTLVGLRHTFTTNSIKLFSQGLLTLKPIRLSQRSAVQLRGGDTDFPQLDLESISEFFITELAAADVQQPENLFLVCSVCNTPKDVAKLSLLKAGIWNPLSVSNAMLSVLRDNGTALVNSFGIHVPIMPYKGTHVVPIRSAIVRMSSKIAVWLSPNSLTNYLSTPLLMLPGRGGVLGKGFLEVTSKEKRLPTTGREVAPGQNGPASRLKLGYHQSFYLLSSPSDSRLQ